MKCGISGAAVSITVAWLAVGACGGSSTTEYPAADGGGAGGASGAGGGVTGGASGTGAASSGGAGFGGSPSGGSGGSGLGGVPSGGTGGTGGGSGGASGLCLLTNCNTDFDCAGCSFNRTKCLLSEHRCVACDPNTGAGCPVGQTCTSFGTCAPASQTCPTDALGTPTLKCSASSDCAACDPMHQLCEVSLQKCVACTSANTSLCGTSQICVGNQCQDQCPTPCAVDSSCAACDFTGPLGGMKAHACFQQVCSECSATSPCPSGTVCQKGACVKPCGLPTAFGTCTTATDCSSCGAGAPTSQYQCVAGKCTIDTAGCTLLATAGLLPTPWDKSLSLCSSDANCAGVSSSYNVGELVRSVLGSSELDIGIKKLQIQDALVAYAVPRCSSVSLSNNVTCGVCTPCLADADCKSIKLDVLVFDLFKGDPLAQLGGATLLDLLFGSNKDKSLHFQCLAVAPGANVCAPCSDPTKPC